MLKLNLDFSALFKKPEIQIINIEDIHQYSLYAPQKEWVEWAFSGGNKLLLGARDYGKTETVVTFGIFEMLLKDPSLTFLIYTRKEAEAKDLLRVLRNKLKISGLPLAASTETQIITKRNGELMKKEPSVGIKSLTADGQKGKHYDYIIFDDPVDIMDTPNSAITRRISKVVANLSSVANKGVVIIGQPVFKGDLYQSLCLKIDTRLYPVGSIPQRDKTFEELQKSNPMVTKTYYKYNYELDYVDLEIQPLSSFFVSDKTINLANATFFLDPSLTGNDYTAFACGEIINDVLYVYGKQYKKSWYEAYNDYKDVFTKCGSAYYERNNLGDALYFHAQDKGHSIAGINQKQMNKEKRILQLEGLIKTKKIVATKDCDLEFIKAVREFNSDGSSLHDDSPDALRSLCTVLGII